MTEESSRKIAEITRDVMLRAVPIDQFLQDVAGRLREVPSGHPGLEISGIEIGSFIFGGTLCRVPTFYGRECLQPGPVIVTASDFADALDRVCDRVEAIGDQGDFLRFLGLTLAELGRAPSQGTPSP